MVRMTWKGDVVFVSPTGIRVIRPDTYSTPAVSVIEYDDGQTAMVDGNTEAVHAALFPPAQYEVPLEKCEALKANLQGLESGGHFVPWVPVRGSEANLEEALNPATYEAEWQNHSPNCARAMAWALGLVRARLGVKP